MAAVKPKQCVCGKYPKIEEQVRYYGGGRYKGKSKVVTWKAICQGCWRRETGESKTQVTNEWNAQVIRALARLLVDLGD